MRDDWSPTVSTAQWLHRITIRENTRYYLALDGTPLLFHVPDQVADFLLDPIHVYFHTGGALLLLRYDNNSTAGLLLWYELVVPGYTTPPLSKFREALIWLLLGCWNFRAVPLTDSCVASKREKILVKGQDQRVLKWARPEASFLGPWSGEIRDYAHRRSSNPSAEILSGEEELSPSQPDWEDYENIPYISVQQESLGVSITVRNDARSHDSGPLEPEIQNKLIQLYSLCGWLACSSREEFFRQTGASLCDSKRSLWIPDVTPLSPLRRNRASQYQPVKGIW